MSVHRRRNSLGLPYSPRHFQFLRETTQTVSEAVTAFIETDAAAKTALADKIKRLRRSEAGLPAAFGLMACKHDRASAQSSNCNICAREWREWLVPQPVAYSQLGVVSTVVTVLIKEVPFGGLTRVCLHHEREAFRKRLQRCGFHACIGNMEAAYKPERQTWSLHAHLLVFGPCDEACGCLKKRIALPRCVDQEPLIAARRVRQITYLFKFVTFHRHPSTPRPYPLPDQQLAELARWRMRYSLGDHLVLIGFQRRGVICPGPAFRRLLARPWRRGDVETSIRRSTSPCRTTRD